MHPETSDSRGYAMALLSAAILSTTGLFIRHLTVAYGLPALVLAFWRAGFAALTLLVALAILKPAVLRVQIKDLGFLILYGLVLALFNAIWTFAVEETGASLATVLVNGSAACTALLGWWLLREGLDGAKLAAIVLSLVGCALVSKIGMNGRVRLSGVAAGLVSAILYAAYSLMGRHASQRGLNTWTTVACTFAFASLFLLIFNLGVHPAAPRLLHLGQDRAGWSWLLLLAAGPTVLGFGLYNASLRHLPSSVANLIVSSEPVFTALLAYRLFGERLDASQLMGSALILGGVGLLRLSEFRRGAQLVLD